MPAPSRTAHSFCKAEHNHKYLKVVWIVTVWYDQSFLMFWYEIVTKVKTDVLIVGQSGEFMSNAGSVSYLWFFGIFDRNSLGDCRAHR